MLAVRLANRESTTSWREFLLPSNGSGLRGGCIGLTTISAGVNEIGVHSPPSHFRSTLARVFRLHCSEPLRR